MLALVGSAAIASYWPPAGVGALVFCLVVIYLRGYLVPGTPTLTERYLPESVLRVFDGSDPGSRPATRGPAPTPDDPSLDDPESVLSDAGAIEPCPAEDDLCLTTGFRTAWRDRMDTIRSDGGERAILRELMAVDDAIHLDDENPENVVVAHTGTTPIGYWESRPAFLADLGAAAELSSRYEGWTELSVEGRNQALNGLRIFLDRCPACDGEVTVGEQRVRSCCRSHDVLAVSCIECGARLLEVDAPDATPAA